MVFLRIRPHRAHSNEMELNDDRYEIIGVAMKFNYVIGPGLRE